VTNAADGKGLGGRVLFVPVSGARGMGEYARALALATAAAQRLPDLQIHFVVSQQAPYAAGTPFPTTLVPSSPTFHSVEVAEVIRTFRPTLVVFDNAGRTTQLQAAAKAGARVIYVSSRVRQRRKAFRPQWMRVIDEHWIAYPEFIAGSSGFFEKLLMSLMGRPRLRFLDAILPPTEAERAQGVRSQFAIRDGEYVLVVPGGGSDYERAKNAPQIVAEAARRLALRGYPTIVVGVSALTGEQANESLPPELRLSPRIPMAALGELIRRARVVISNGGDTLLQTLACNRACVAIPIAGDQPHRIEKCVQASLALGATLDSDDIERVALSVLQNDELRQRLERTTAQAGIANAMESALAAIERLAVPA
jgi:UDP:flavonoid glycosyltransferase YjiC (YdhE family)